MRKFLGCVALFTVIGCAASAAPAAAGLSAADRAFSDLSVAKGSNAAFLAYSASDVRVFGTGSEPPIYGKAAMAKRFETSGNGDPAKNRLSWTPAHAEVSAGGKMGETDGAWLFEGTGGKAPVRVTGHYLTVWRLEAGEWKVIADMGTTDPSKP